VIIESPSNALVVRYTIDGSEPTIGSPLAKGSIAINASCTLKARTFHNGKPASGIAQKQFTRVTPRPAQSPVSAVEPGLYSMTYAGDWNQLPDFSALEHAAFETVATIALPKGTSQERIARVFFGRISVPADEVYVFSLSSDDGSRLLIDTDVIIDNDGLHSSTERTGVIALAAGAHDFQVQHFNKTGGAECVLRLAPAGQSLKDVDPTMFTRIPLAR
jgi:hexosaminidase